MFRKKGKYDGPVAFLAAEGWHYSTKINRHGHEVLDKRLYLNTDDPENIFYEYARKHSKSWVERHGVGNITTLGGQG